jgi:hypothetical protein
MPSIHQRRAVQIIVAVCVLLSINWVFAVARFQPNVLFMDQWDFLLPLFDGKGAWARFVQQHGPHRQGLSFILEGWILEATAWDVRYESLWIAAVLLVATLLALRLKWKMTGGLTLLDGWIPVMGLSLGQFETVLSTPNASVGAFPLALILLTANIWLGPNPAIRYLSAGAFAFALTFTGFGIVGSVVIAVLIVASIIRHAFKRDHESAWFAVGGLLLAGAGWIRFLSDYVFMPAVEGFRFPWTPWTDYVRFITLMLILPTGEAGERWPHYVLGGTLAVVIVLAAAGIVRAWVKRGASLKNDVLMLLMGSGLAFVVATAIGRVPLGLAGATAPRYLTLMVPMWLALYLGADVWRRRWVAAAATACVWILALGPYVSMVRRPLQEWPGTLGMTDNQLYATMLYGTGKAEWANVYLRTGRWDAAQAAVEVTLYPDPVASNFDRKLRFLRERKLSFFSGQPARCDYLPWLADAAFLNQALGSNRRECR